ncbi:MAG: putative bifunctional diguanylate cyclase/phosphodiesterase, partial [Cellulosilyticaceae bacterium]
EGRDSLTGFMNKDEFCKYSTKLLKEHLVNSKYRFVYVVAKIDGFEQVNKSYGYELGDELIIYVSGILHNTVEPVLDKTIGRIHRDEVVMLIGHEENLQAVVAYLERIKEYVERGFNRNGSLIPLSMSMGVVNCDDNETNIRRIHQKATIALDIARAHNRNQLLWYEEAMYDTMREKAEILRLLQSYNLRQSLYVVFQPIYELKHDAIKGVELLLRMRDLAGNTIGPSKFIPLAEENYLMNEIGYFCIEEACKLLRCLRDQNMRLGYVSVNLSVQQLRDIHLVEHIKRYAYQYSIDPEHLHFEIVESMLIEDYDRTQIILQSLRQLGCKILLDDFGTGYSSLSYLSHVAIDVVKLDRSFLGELKQNSKSRIVFASIIRMIKQLDMGCIVEGVETEEERCYVELYGGELIQGYLMSRPLTTEKIIQVLSARGV